MRNVPSPLTIPTEAGTVNIQADEGRIHLDASELAQACGTDFLERLLEQAVVSNAVDSVEIDRVQGTATIGYDSNRWNVPEALTYIARMLQGDQHCAPDRSEVSLDLSSIAGVVTRVDRVRTVTAPGTRDATRLRDWITRLSPRGRKTAAGPARETNAVMQGLIIHYEPVEPLIAEADLDAEQRVAEADPMEGESALATTIAGEGPVLPVEGWRRAANLAAAGGCFALSIIGFITPGIPTLPFVLATSHFLVRSTPALNERLRESRLFGAIVRDWEDQGGMRQRTKLRTLLVMFSLLGATALLSGGSLPVLMMTSAVGGIDLLVVMAIPTIEEEHALPPPQLRLEYQPLVA
jgi:uncharacterized membrane protein YbaN (DUF454 family)